MKLYQVIAILVVVVGCARIPQSMPTAATPSPSYKGTQEYKKAFRAGRDAVLLSQTTEGIAKGFVDATSSTCCEATAAVTQGWYAGQDYGGACLEELMQEENMSIAQKQSALLKLQKEIQHNPVTNWYIPDL